MSTELCKYEFLTCRQNTSPSPYICVYQLLGEVPAFFYGWLQCINRAAIVALLARSLGSVLVLIVGNGKAMHDKHIMIYLPSVIYCICTYASNSVLELLEFDSNSNTDIVNFYYYFITLIGIEFGIRFSLNWLRSLELGTVCYY